MPWLGVADLSNTTTTATITLVFDLPPEATPVELQLAGDWLDDPAWVDLTP